MAQINGYEENFDNFLGVDNSLNTHHIEISYYVNFLGRLDNNGRSKQWISDKIKVWHPTMAKTEIIYPKKVGA